MHRVGLHGGLESRASLSRAEGAHHGHDVVDVVDLDPVAARQEVVEARQELRVAVEEGGDPGDHARHVEGPLVERLHDAQEVLVHVGLVAELGLYRAQVRQSILNLFALELHSIPISTK